jgi:hypothetical protein
MQRALLELVISASYLSHTADVLTSKVAKRMLSQKVEIESLPSDFWKQEVLAWEQESYAGVQIAMSRYATGGVGAEAEDQADDAWWIKPGTEGEKNLCKMQKMKKSGGFV